MRATCTILFLLICLTGQTQSITGDRVYVKEVELNVDNDQPFMTDRYYTAGQDLYYRFLVRPDFSLLHSDDSSKTVMAIHYGNKIFNPRNLDTMDPFYMDRPYCGWSFFSAEVQHFRRKNSGNFLAIQMGVVGKESGMEKLQKWWHRTIHLYPLEGWDSQIVNEFVVNLNYNHAHAFPISKRMEMVSVTSAWAGTGNNRLSEEVTLRLFRFNKLSESAFLASRISEKNIPAKEFFLFTSFGADYVISNIFIQGSLFKDNPSPYTTGINPWLFTSKIGVQYAGGRISASGAVIHLSKETPFVGDHFYASISFSYRFKKN